MKLIYVKDHEGREHGINPQHIVQLRPAAENDQETVIELSNGFFIVAKRLMYGLGSEFAHSTQESEK